MILESYELAKAVVFFDAHRIVKSMLYTEFEAILDGYVPAVEFANTSCEAVYVEINAAFEVCTAVFFRVAFGGNGEIEPGWNLPIDQLAAMADPVPDIGLGHFRLVCYSQCPIRYFQEYLWEPDSGNGNRQLRALQRFINDNRLAIRFRHAAGNRLVGEEPQRRFAAEASRSELVELVPPKELAQENQQLNEFKAQLKSLQIQGAVAKKENEASIAKLKQDHERRIAEYRALFMEKDRQIKALRERNQNLQETIDEKHSKLLGVRHYYEHKLSLAESHEKELAESLYENFEKDLQQMRQSDLKDYKQRLKMRDIEIQDCKDKDRALQQDVAKLRQQNEALIKSQGIELLQNLLAKGGSLVKFQSASQHIDIPLEDIDKFLDNPQAYVAARCGVSEAQYHGWQRHLEEPVCVAVDADGQFCGDTIDCCEKPSDFQRGVSDRCSRHKVFGQFGKYKAVSA